jgi:curli biogenesis system outer membrane secretion channel CsgG
MIVPYSNFSTVFKKKICYLRDLYCEAMKHCSWLLLLISLLNLQCGYRLSGRGRNLPATAQTIAIPGFKNETPRYQAERFVTDAIREEFIKRSRLRLSESITKADLVLEGRISAFETKPVSNTGRGAANRYEISITVSIRVIDMKKNELFYEGTGLIFRETYETDAADFFSQETGSLGKITAKFASSIVTSILDNF